MTLLFQTLNYGACAQVYYDIKDLEVLEREKNFDEFLVHVNDIRPSERGRHWKEMYQNMAIGLVDYKMKTHDFSLETWRQVDQLGRSSALNNDEFFQLRRSLYAKKYFSECFRKTTLISEVAKKTEEAKLCDSIISTYWTYTKKDPDIGLEIAAILEANHSGLKLWPFYEKASKDSISNLYCKKPAVQTAIMNKLYEETFTPEFDGNYRKLVNKFLSEDCFNEMSSPLKNMLSSPKSNGLEKEMAMNLLEAKSKLTSEELDLYAILFLLDGPVVGEKMNLAWKKVENLGENFPKRQKILGLIEKLPIIPDKIFKDPNLPRHKAIINLFAKNFPEYLNYYGSTCIKFISNSGDGLLNVSSSFQCNEFLKAAGAVTKEEKGLSGPWVSDSVQRQYSGLKK